MSEWVLAVERAYVAAATGGERDRALAALGAVASRYLAVGTPRTLGTIVKAVADAPLAKLSVDAHATWFAPREIRNIVLDRGDPPATALACDIVCIHASMTVRARDIRRGTHVNALAQVMLDPELKRLATIVHEIPGLGQLAAGIVDGRQLDEITVFIAGEAAIALGAVIRATP